MDNLLNYISFNKTRRNTQNNFFFFSIVDYDMFAIHCLVCLYDANAVKCIYYRKHVKWNVSKVYISFELDCELEDIEQFIEMVNRFDEH